MPRTYEANLVQKTVQTIQMLSVDGVEKAKSGHPGTPMALASIAFEIWTRHLRYDPTDPSWPDRDRFILSAGHASMLLYSMLHLSGYDLPLDELKRFRQWGSKTAGHPEMHLLKGVEVTTGPLGQGISNAVGVAAGLKMLGARFNAPGSQIFGGRVFGIASDGDLMEGVSAEASSLAGHLGVNNLIFFYDDNHITIDGKTSLAFSEDVGARYEAYGWYVQRIDGHNHDEIRVALDNAVAERERPSLIIARTHIGIGSPKQDSNKAHGEPLGEADVKATKQKMGWPLEPTFLVPEEVYALFRERAEDGKKERAAWRDLEAKLRAAGGPKAELYEKIIGDKKIPADLFEQLLKVAPTKDAATRAQSGIIEQKVAELVPAFVGGSADLNPSTKTYIEGSPAIAKHTFEGRNVHFGIREHGMGAFVNGLATTGFIPFGSTFLIFSDYMRASIRLAALSHEHSLFIFTHDSVYLGEDGPTHQPVEHFWALRLIPNLDFVRPCDALECAAAWTLALRRSDGPTAMALTRQTVPNIPREAGFDPKSMLRGAYVLAEASGGAPTIVLVATGSEVHVAIGAKKLLDAKGHRARVVSVPCFEEFQRQDAAYRESVLPRSVPRVVVEIGRSYPWRGLTGENGLVIGWDDFGASAPDKEIAKHFGFTAEAIAAKIESALGSAKS
jgi:transketolase